MSKVALLALLVALFAVGWSVTESPWMEEFFPICEGQLASPGKPARLFCSVPPVTDVPSLSPVVATILRARDWFKSSFQQSLALLVTRLASFSLQEDEHVYFITSSELSGPVEILRDSHGIPSVTARSLSDAAFAQGFIQAQDR